MNAPRREVREAHILPIYSIYQPNYKHTYLPTSVDHGVQEEFSLGALDDALLDTTCGDQAIDMYHPSLSDAVDPSHSLIVRLRVPIRVEEDDGVCREEIQTLPTSTSRQTEDEDRRLGLVEQIDLHLSHHPVRGAIEATVSISSHVQVV
jgi:hypothetical protein